MGMTSLLLALAGIITTIIQYCFGSNFYRIAVILLHPWNEGYEKSGKRRRNQCTDF